MTRERSGMVLVWIAAGLLFWTVVWMVLGMTELLMTAAIVLVICVGYILLEWVLGPEPEEWWPGDRPKWRP